MATWGSGRFLSSLFSAISLMLAVGLEFGEASCYMLAHQVAPLCWHGIEHPRTLLARGLGENGGGMLAWGSG